MRQNRPAISGQNSLALTEGEEHALQRVPGKERERPGIADHKGKYRADFEGRTEPAEKTRTGTIIKQP